MKDFIHVQFLDSDASLGTKGFCLEECMGLEIYVELCYVLVPSEKMSRKKKETVAFTKRSYYTSKPGGWLKKSKIKPKVTSQKSS